MPELGKIIFELLKPRQVDSLTLLDTRLELSSRMMIRVEMFSQRGWRTTVNLPVHTEGVMLQPILVMLGQ